MELSDFARFFNANKNGTYKCSFCGKESFSVTVFGGTLARRPLQSKSEAGAAAVGSQDFYSVICTTCGRTDLFSSGTVDNWVESNKSGAENG